MIINSLIFFNINSFKKHYDLGRLPFHITNLKSRSTFPLACHFFLGGANWG